MVENREQGTPRRDQATWTTDDFGDDRNETALTTTAIKAK